jgi:molybdopterin-guanine dinucleotide biosynthesis protein A
MMGVAGVILAGGLSTRMGRDKALVPFAGRPMIAHAIERLAPQVACLAVSANGDAARFDPFGLTILPDARTDHPGPLAGIATGLRFAADRGCRFLATAPCDAPFAPRDLVARLRGDGALPAVAKSPDGVEPLFALWPVAMLGHVEAALATGDASVWRLLAAMGAREVDIPADPGERWWLNLNAPDELAAADRRAP